ncbi:MAG: PH domain-containing protein [Actinomycetaceae bacterium]|nr:PH domain-containing protein [Actinomycetaceae bacterium]
MSLKDTQTQLDWQRFSLLSIVKSVFLIFAALLVVAWNLLENIVSGKPDDDGFFEMLFGLGWIGLLIGIGILVVLILFTLGFGYMQWKREEFAFSTDAVHSRSGIFFKSNESLPYKRIQTVEIERTIFDRLFRMATLKIDTGADATEAMKLGLLPYEGIAQLRSWLLAASNAARQGVQLPRPPQKYAGNFPQNVDVETAPIQLADYSEARAAGIVPAAIWKPDMNSASAPAPDTVTVPAPDTELAPHNDVLMYHLSLKNLIISKIISLGFGGILGGVGLFILAFIAEEFSLIAFLFAAIGFGASIVSSVSKQWDTRLYISDNGVRLRAGLTTVTSRTIAPERVHLITIKRSLVMRLLGMWSLAVTYPGMDADSDDVETSLKLVPLGTRADIERVLWIFANNLGMDSPGALLDECMLPRKQLERQRIGGLEGVRFASFASERARYINPFSWRWSACVCTDEVVIKRSRRLLTDSIDILFHEHWQSISVGQGPLSRKLKVASLEICLVEGDFMLANYPETEMPVAVDELRRFSQARRAASLPSSRGSEAADAIRAWRERCQTVVPRFAIPER